MLATLVPAVIVLLIMDSRFVRDMFKGGPLMEGPEVKFMLLMLYFGIATISMIVAKAFPCTSFDAVDDNGNRFEEKFLTADMTINCDKIPFLRKLYLWLTLLLYPVGVPCLFFVLLYHRREAITLRETRLIGQGSNAIPPPQRFQHHPAGLRLTPYTLRPSPLSKGRPGA